MRGSDRVSRRINFEEEQKILSELDYLNSQEDFVREDMVWCNKTIKKLLLELHLMRNELASNN